MCTKIYLDNSLLTKFNTEGWIGPFDLLDNDELLDLRHSYRLNKDKFKFRDYTEEYNNSIPFVWFKSMHTNIPNYKSILEKKEIKDLVKNILGKNAVAWGMTVTERKPGQIHKWHGDLEHFKWDGITIYIGLENTTPKNSLKILPGSHKWNDLPQLYGFNSEDDILKFTKVKYKNSKIIDVSVKDGQFFLFHGKLWHASENRSEVTRLAIITQFSNNSVELRIPLNYEMPTQWTDYSPPIIEL